MDAAELARNGVAPPTGVFDVRLPELRTEAIIWSGHGKPEDVLELSDAHPLPVMLGYGQVLVKMIAAPISDDDFKWMQQPKCELNKAHPFCRPGNSMAEWEPGSCAGVDGVGVVVATAKCVTFDLLRSICNKSE
jgi:trans-2-enoyl-CoA reductase